MSNTNRKENIVSKRGKTHVLPATDVDQFATEVLSRGLGAALPQNLPDRWLRRLGRDIVISQKAILEGRDDDPNVKIATLLLVVAAFLSEKLVSCGADPALSDDMLLVGLQRYESAISEEIIGRQTGVFLRKYTLDTIV